MGITIVQKSDLSRQRPHARRALVLAGGAISGGAFKIGGLMALDRFLRNFRVTDFDLYVGVSAGAFLAAPMTAGVSPEELFAAINGDSERVTRFQPLDFYLPNWREFITKPARAARDAALYGPRISWKLARTIPTRRREIGQRARDFVEEPCLATAEALLEPFMHELFRQRLDTWSFLPSGFFDNQRIEAYIRHNLERNGLPNTFRQLKLQTGKSLYIGATNLNTAQGVVFGHDEDNSVTISEAVQASTAIPVFFKPARVGPSGREQDYCDAAVRKTANISTAVRHGAELIICYNPFRPFVNYRHRLREGSRSLADLGMYAIINQAMRTVLHSRLRLGIQKLRLDPNFRGDCILIEPAETDSRFFAINPLAFWRRQQAAEHGYESVKASLTKHHEALRRILSAYGVEVDLAHLESGIEVLRDERTTSRAGRERTRRPDLRVVSGA